MRRGITSRNYKGRKVKMLQLGIEKKQNSVVGILKEEILSGNIPCGTEMTQTELAESLGVSRMPVREALILLEYQGLVERLPNNHVKVTEFGENYFREVFSLCEQLERSVLASGYVPEKPEQQSRFTEYSLEEMMLHHQISRKLCNGFLRKTLDTILDIYVDFAIKCRAYNQKQGEELFKSALYASPEHRKTLLNQYYSELERVILAERSSRC